MTNYFKFIQEYPALFDNTDALFQIILDPDIIKNWEKQKKDELQEKNLPLEWGNIGIVLNDPYNLIIRDLVRFPNGEMRGYGRSIATASLKGGKGVAVLPVFEEKIMLLHQYRHATRQWHYEVPRGYGEPYISAQENARIEIEEETGGQIDILIEMGDLHNNTGYEMVSVALFFARMISIGNPNRNEGITNFTYLTKDELEEWIADGRITDGFTIAAYTKAKIKGLI